MGCSDVYCESQLVDRNASLFARPNKLGISLAERFPFGGACFLTDCPERSLAHCVHTCHACLEAMFAALGDNFGLAEMFSPPASRSRGGRPAHAQPETKATYHAF